MKLFGVYGASGCGRGIMPLVRFQAEAAYGQGARCVFIDDAATEQEINGHHVMRFADFLASPAASRQVCLAIADAQIRRDLDRRCAEAGIGFFSVRAANVVEMDDVQLGEGALLSPFVTLTSNIRIGRHFQANLYSYVEHDCVIGNFVTFAPGVHCNGNVHIGDGAYVGAGAILRQGAPGRPLRIGAGAVVGMGAVVTRDVPAGSTVVGNPARRFVKEKSSC